MSDPLALLDATGQAALVRSGDVSPLELVDAAIARVEACEPRLHALTTTSFERARTVAASPDLPDGPFRGVPFLLKDLGATLAGEPDYEGMQVLKDLDHRADVTSAAVRRIERAGLVVLGRTNTPELGIMPTTEPATYPATANPWAPERTPGGSSGGSAAAVTAGMVPAAHASDGGGSIRIPASCCGLVGLKPSRGRVSLGPHGGELARFLTCQFVLARSVRDAAALLDVLAGEEPGDPVVPAPPSRPFSSVLATPPARLRVGMMTDAPRGATSVHPDCVAATEHAGKVLESLGHTVERAHPDALDEPAGPGLFAAVWSANAAHNLDVWGRVVGRELTSDDVEPLTWALVERGRHVSASQFLDAVAAMQAFTRRAAQWWADGFDLLLTPTLGEPPPQLGVLSTPDAPFEGFRRAASFTPFTPPFNITGQPAISVPLGESDGLPVGVQLVAAYGGDATLLAVAAQLETAAPWAQRCPLVHA